jgi:hypothetical protein
MEAAVGLERLLLKFGTPKRPQYFLIQDDEGSPSHTIIKFFGCVAVWGTGLTFNKQLHGPLLFMKSRSGVHHWCCTVCLAELE